MLKPKGLGQDTLIGLSCGGALEHVRLRRPAFSFSFSLARLKNGSKVPHLRHLPKCSSTTGPAATS